MNNFFVIAFFLLVAILLGRMLAVPQQLRLNKELQKIKKRGEISSVGLAKSILGTRAAILIANKDGSICEAYKISGRSIAAKFVRDTDFPHHNHKEIISSLSLKKRLSTQEKAYLFAANYIKDGIE